MSNIPQVKRMMMFKHGVAYLERGGPADGPFELSFKREEMNDLLKSFAVWVAQGDARVGAVAFEAPEDPEKILAQRKLLLKPGSALQDLLHSLRGRMVIIGNGRTEIQGEVIGFEQAPGGKQPPRRSLLLRTKNGEVSLMDITAIETVSLVEESSRTDLAFLIDRSRAATAGENRTLCISLSGETADLRVTYVIPAPVWRVSYRLVRDKEKTVLMAWAIVHNPADEDLNDIELTLTTGQPISFVIDLYNPKHVQRTIVEEKSRVAAAPTQFERSYPAAAPAPTRAMAKAEFLATGESLAEESYLMVDAMVAATAGAATTADRSEFFEYRVATPVSLKRGGSAMVPLVTMHLDAHKERIWRHGSGTSPDLVLTFQNGTGVVLEEGPVLVYDQGAYAGESMMPYSARGVEVKLAFAKDLGVRCQHKSNTHYIVNEIRINLQGLMEEQRYEEHHLFRAESDHSEEVEIIFEKPRTYGRSLDPSYTQPFEETNSFHRFRVKVAAHDKAEIRVVERWLVSRLVQYEHLSAPQLANWLADRFLDQATYNALSEILNAWQRARERDEQQAQLIQLQQAAYNKQEKISQQLAVLKEGGPEGSLRLRYVKELEAEQDKVNHYEEEIERLRNETNQLRKLAVDKLTELTK